MRPCRPYTLWACHRQSISTDRLAHNVQCCADLIRELVMVREGLLVLSDSRISKDDVCAAIEHLCVECMIATVLWLLLCFFLCLYLLCTSCTMIIITMIIIRLAVMMQFMSIFCEVCSRVTDSLWCLDIKTVAAKQRQIALMLLKLANRSLAQRSLVVY